MHIEPDEADTLAHIPRQVLFPAPKLPRGHLLMGYDEHGRCPMLIGHRCSIYLHRQKTCRLYDCRVFAVDGVRIELTGKALVALQVSRWQFRRPREQDKVALRRCARPHSTSLTTPTSSPTSLQWPRPAQRSLLTIELHELFVDRAIGGPRLATPSLPAMRAEIRSGGAR